MDNNQDTSLAQRWVKNALRSEMVKRGLSYADLTERLSQFGVGDDERVIRNKVARGSFSAAFFIQCLTAIGSKTLSIDLLDYRNEESADETNSGPA